MRASPRIAAIRALLGAAVVVTAFGRLNAQASYQLSLEGGGAQITQPRHNPVAAALLSALWRGTSSHTATLLSASMTYAGDSATAGQAIAAFAWRPIGDGLALTGTERWWGILARSWHMEGGGTGTTFGFSPLGNGGNGSAYIRQRFGLSRTAFWVGGALGHTWRDNTTSHSSHSSAADAGVSVRMGDVEAVVSLSRFRSSDFALFRASALFLAQSAAAHDLNDAIAALRYARGSLAVDATGTWRHGVRASLANQQGLYANVSYALSPSFTLACAGGRQLADPVRGSPEARVISLTARVAVWPRGEGRAMPVIRASARLLPQPSGGLLIVRVSAPDSAYVEIAGTFSDWMPVPMYRTPVGWEAQIPLPSGTHRVAVRVNGGAWWAPANLARMRDEFGGASGLVVVP